MADHLEDEEKGEPPSSPSPRLPQEHPQTNAPTAPSAEHDAEDPLERLFSMGELRPREPDLASHAAPWADVVEQDTAQVIEDIGAPVPPVEPIPHEPTPASSPQLDEPVRYVPPSTPRITPSQYIAPQVSTQPQGAAQPSGTPVAPASFDQPQVQPIPQQAPAPSQPAAQMQGGTAPVQAAIEPQSAPQRQVVSLAPESLRTSTTTSLPVVVPFGAASAPPAPVEAGQMVRCRACGKSAPAQLALCPHCGRELRPAPSRWLTIGVPAALALLLVALIGLQASRGQGGWLGGTAESANGWIEQLSASLDPQINVIPNNESAVSSALSADFVAPTVAVEGGETGPDLGSLANVSGASLVGDDGSTTSVTSAELQSASGVAEEIAPEVAPSVPGTATESAGLGVGAADSAGESAVEDAAATATQLAAGAALALPTQTLPATATSIPTETPTPEPTDTPAPTNTPLPPSYTVQSGDTALGIATRLGIALDDLLAYNGMTERQATLLQPGQVLRIPGGVVTADTAAGERTYVVRDGDTLVQIARVNGSTVAAIMAANNMTQADVFALRPGQTLVIPAPTPEPAVATAAAVAATSAAATASAPAPTPLPTVAPTSAPIEAATAAPVVATSAPATTGMRVTAPILRAPVTGVTLNCSRPASLQWLRSPDILPDDSYRVHLGFVGGRDDGGNPRITWIVEQSVASDVTQLALDSTLCSAAPDDYGNQWRWYVDVVATVDGNKLPVSTPSDIWGFAWN